VDVGLEDLSVDFFGKSSPPQCSFFVVEKNVQTETSSNGLVGSPETLI
jgi:hypothetical protein